MGRSPCINCQQWNTKDFPDCSTKCEKRIKYADSFDCYHNVNYNLTPYTMFPINHTLFLKNCFMLDHVN